MNRGRIALIGALLIFLGTAAFVLRARAVDDTFILPSIGDIQALPTDPSFVGDWTVSFIADRGSCRTVHVTSPTVLDQAGGKIAIGAWVLVAGTPRADGSIDATKITTLPLLLPVRLGCASPTASPTPRPSPPPFCFEFIGTVNSLPGTSNLVGDWSVNHRTVHVSSSTEIDQEHAQVKVGALVEVEGCLQNDGSINATEIEVISLEPPPPPCITFFGVVENLPGTADLTGDWTVSHRTVHVTSPTILKHELGPFVVGAFVKVKGCLRMDGSLDASFIEVEKPPIISPPFPFFELFGTVSSLPPAPFVGDWNVSGRTVHVSSSTHIDLMNRPLVAGALVKVVGGLEADGSIDAIAIEVLRNNDIDKHVNFFELFGTVQKLPGGTLIGDWTVSGLTVHVTANTRIRQDPDHPVAVGAKVLVVGTQETDLSLDAARIAVMRNISAAQDFVTQNYQDFLNRDPDSGGLDYWSNQITKCASDPVCTENQRVNVSAAFFLSTEFQETGYLVYRFYQASFGRQPYFVEFIPDVETISQNIGTGPDVLELNKQAFADDWVSHPAFTGAYDGKTNAEYVDLLYGNAGITPDQTERDALVAGLDNGTETRATVLRKVADNPAFFQQEFNRAFVLMQYFGYLRRDPDQQGYDFWVNIMDRLNGDFRQAQMVQAFIDSAEYNDRFPQ